MNDKIKSALDVNSDAQVEAENNTAAAPVDSIPTPEPENRVITTPEELEAFFIVKMLLKDTVSLEDLSYKDTINYISMLYQGKVTKWICRFILSLAANALGSSFALFSLTPEDILCKEIF